MLYIVGDGDGGGMVTKTGYRPTMTNPSPTHGHLHRRSVHLIRCPPPRSVKTSREPVMIKETGIILGTAHCQEWQSPYNWIPYRFIVESKEITLRHIQTICLVLIICVQSFLGTDEIDDHLTLSLPFFRHGHTLRCEAGWPNRRWVFP